MKEMVSTEQVERTLQILALVAPLVGLAVGSVAGCVGRRRARCMVSGILAGLAGTAVFGLWRVFHMLGSHSGFAGVGFIGGQAVLFIGIGMVAGVVIRRRIGAPIGRKHSLTSVKSDQEDKLNA